MDTLTKYILDRLEGILADQVNSNSSLKYNAFNTTYRLLSGWMTANIENHVNILSKNRFIQNESSELTKNMYNILNPDQNYLQNIFKRRAKSNPKLAEFIQSLESSMTPLRNNGFKS
jgi:hypothetical protein